MIPINRKWISLLLTAAVCLGMASCGEPASSSSSAPEVTHEDALADAEVLKINPVTGEKLADGVEPGTRPVAVMIDNAPKALPQRGIASADAIVEMITEGGITRLMALYSNPSAIPRVGPVRSARDQHLQIALPLNSLVAHIGTSVYANNLLNLYGYKTVDGLYLGSTSYWFDEARKKDQGYAVERCWYTDAALVSAGVDAIGESRTGKNYTLFPFASNKRTLSGIDAPDVSFSFSDQAAVGFTYQAETGKYLKTQNGAAHVDELDGSQLAFDNVVILFATVGLKQDAYCSDYDMSGGTGWYLCGGKAVQLTWEKGAPESPITLKSESGEALEINPGKSYLGVVSQDRSGTLVINAAAQQPAESTSTAQ